MGVYIKGMEMPTSCDECPLYTCMHNHDNCPLVPIPPHGRLIDADALAEHKFVCIPYVDLDGKNVGRAYKLGWNNAIEAIMENAETIIGGK